MQCAMINKNIFQNIYSDHTLVLQQKSLIPKTQVTQMIHH